MNIQFWHSRDWDFEKELYTPIKEFALYKQYNFLFPHEAWKKSPNSRETLKDMDVFLCDVSRNSIGLWIEIWFASLYWIRIVCIYKKWTNISGSLKYVTDEFIEYKDSNDMVKRLEEVL